MAVLDGKQVLVAGVLRKRDPGLAFGVLSLKLGNELILIDDHATDPVYDIKNAVRQILDKLQKLHVVLVQNLPRMACEALVSVVIFFRLEDLCDHKLQLPLVGVIDAELLKAVMPQYLEAEQV